MKYGLLKKLGILGMVVMMMASTAAANGWTIGLVKTRMTPSDSTGKKETRDNYAIVKRTDQSSFSIWSRTQFLTYVMAEEDGIIYKSETGTVTYPIAETKVYYPNYSSDYVNKEYMTYAQLSPTAYFNNYSLSGQTTP